jgi:4'-phosphopantetheinyl transferase EntD
VEQLKSLLGPDVELEVGAVEGVPSRGLLPAEVAAVAGAVPSRQAEFLTGRALARTALARLGVHGYPLLPGDDRAPRWPAGIVGSITHTRDTCAVAVARSQSVRALGIDAEPREPLEESVWPTVCTDAERRALALIPSSERGLRARLLFSAKEAVFKCVYPATGHFLEFTDAELTFDVSAQTFEATLREPVQAFPSRLVGQWRWNDALIVTALRVSPDGV